MYGALVSGNGSCDYGYYRFIVLCYYKGIGFVRVTGEHLRQAWSLHYLHIAYVVIDAYETAFTNQHTLHVSLAAYTDRL